MKRPKVRTAILIGGVAFAIIMLITLIFNICVHFWIKNNAKDAIEAVTSYEADNSSEDETKDAIYYAQWVYFKEAKSDSNADELTAREREIYKWVLDNDASDMQSVKLGENSYYIQEFNDFNESGDLLMAYVDVSGGPEIIIGINIAMIIMAIIIGVIGAVFGYYVGLSIEQKELAQMNFFENTSRELKTPLMMIGGYAEAIEQGIVNDDQRTGRIIVGETKHMSDLIEDILYMAKVESGAVHINKEEIRFGEFVEDVLMPFEGAVAELDLRVDVDMATGNVLADPGKLEHVISGLFTYSLKFAKSKIEIKYYNNTFTVWNDLDTNIDEEELANIFDASHTGSKGNTGIGLALAKEIVELHGWRISATSTNNGILFSVSAGRVS